MPVDLTGKRLAKFAATLYPGRSCWYGRCLAAISATPESIERSLNELPLGDLLRCQPDVKALPNAVA